MSSFASLYTALVITSPLTAALSAGGGDGASSAAGAASAACGALLLAVLGCLTRWPGAVVHLLVFVSGLALLADLGSWLLARDTVMLIPVIVAAGAAWMASTTLQVVLVLADLWLPGRR